MPVRWRSTKRAGRHVWLAALGALVCLLAANRPVDASCGDHLSPAKNAPTWLAGGDDFAFAIPPAVVQPPLFRPHPETPCHGRQCHRRPMAPVQDEVPILTMAPRSAFVTTAAPVMTSDLGQWDYEAAPNLSPLAGVPILMDRPPA